MCSLLVNQNVFHHLLLNKYLNIFTWIYFRLWLVVLDISWLSVGGGGWWWIYCGWWWVVVDIFWLVVGGGGYILAGGGWWWVVVNIFWLVVGGGIV